MKYLRYTFNGLTKTISYSEETEKIAKAEAYNGEYTIEDDGTEEITQPTQEERIAELEKAVKDIPSLIQNAIKAALNGANT